MPRLYGFAKERKMDDIVKVLKIFMEAGSTIELAQSLRCWCRYEVRVEKIIGIVPKATRMAGKLASFEGIVAYQVEGRPSERFPPLPERRVPTLGNVDYESKAYAVHYNGGVSEDRSLTIDLRLKEEGTIFASMNLPIRKVSKQCYMLDKPVQFEEDCIISNDFERGMKVRLSARKVVLERGYLGTYYVCMLATRTLSASFLNLVTGSFRAQTRSSSKRNSKSCGVDRTLQPRETEALFFEAQRPNLRKEPVFTAARCHRLGESRRCEPNSSSWG